MRLILICLFKLLFIPVYSQQVGIGTQQPVPGAVLDITDTARGIVIPRIGTDARLRLPNTKGMVVYDSSAVGFYFNNGNQWVNLPPAGSNNGELLYWDGTQWKVLPSGLGGQVLMLETGTHLPKWGGATTDSIFIDPRDNQRYHIKQYGTKIWMTDNMNYYSGYNWCYGNNPDNCNTYGRLYDYYSALLAPPPGWHLATKAEWDTLLNMYGGISVAGGALKSTSELWQQPNTGATNISGFNILPAGWYYHGPVSFFNFINTMVFFWVADSSESLGLLFRNFTTDALYQTTQPWEDGLSVRCVKD